MLVLSLHKLFPALPALPAQTETKSFVAICKTWYRYGQILFSDNLWMVKHWSSLSAGHDTHLLMWASRSCWSSTQSDWSSSVWLTKWKQRIPALEQTGLLQQCQGGSTSVTATCKSGKCYLAISKLNHSPSFWWLGKIIHKWKSVIQPPINLGEYACQTR